jgi:hypothetical protein
MENLDILMGPKLGDFISSLVVPAYYYYLTGRKTNLYICEYYDKFTTSLERTYEELKPILLDQHYVDSFEIFDPEKHALDHNLNAFRENNLISTRPFWAVFLHTVFEYEPEIPYNFTTLKWRKDETYKDYLVVDRKDMFEFNDFIRDQYLHVFSQFDKKVFVTFDKKQYDDFPLKDHLELKLVDSLDEQLAIINGSKMNMLNCSAALCMATALNAPRIIETGKWLNIHYALDYLYFDNVESFDQDEVISPNPVYLKGN